MTVTGTDGREVVISVRGLAKSFGSHQIWESLSLDVYRGEILAIVGGSGQGKSVLMRVITGLVTPDKGDVGLFGQNAKTLTPQARLEIEKRWGILFQDGALFSSLTVLQNIQVPMREHLNLPQAMMDDLAFLKLTMVGLPPNAAHKFPSGICPAACASAPGSPGRSRSTRRSSSWTSRPLASTRSEPPTSIT